jgi:hypothetical protein
MKLLLLLSLSVAAFGQSFLGGDITDAPNHVLAVGMTGGASRADFGGYVGFGERIPGSTATYSYTGATFVPALQTMPNGSRALRVTPVVATGLKQIIYQRGRFTVAVDAGAGASLPSSGTTAFNFAAVGGADLAWRVHKDLRSENHSVTFSPRASQTPFGTVVTFGVGFAWGSH